MFAHRDFLYKRQHGPAHSGSTPSVLGQIDQADKPTPSASSDPKSTPVLTLSTPTSASTTTTTSAAHSSSSIDSSSSTSSTSSSSSSARTTSSSSSSSSTTHTASSPVSTPSALAQTTTSDAPSVSNQTGTNTLFASTPSLSPSSTSSPGSSSGTNTGAIVGGIAGALAGIAVLGFLLMWCMRRQRSRDIDDFDPQAFKRQSAILVDDPVEPQRTYNPRPPTMIERHNVSPALAAQGGYSGQNFYGNYGGHGQQSPYAAPEMIQPADGPPPQAYGVPQTAYTGYNGTQHQVARQPSNVGYLGYDSQQRLARQPSNAEYLTRQPSHAAKYISPTATPGPPDPNAHYIDLNRSSISPYQAAQYADISRQLGTTGPSGPAHKVPELLDDPLPSPFDNPVEPSQAPNVISPFVHVDDPYDVPVPGPVTATPTPQTQKSITGLHQRPATLYEEGDAYGGI